MNNEVLYKDRDSQIKAINDTFDFAKELVSYQHAFYFSLSDVTVDVYFNASNPGFRFSSVIILVDYDSRFEGLKLRNLSFL